MSNKNESTSSLVQVERRFPRFSLSVRWEHFVLILSFTVLLLTGLPQKYRNFEWSQLILSTPQRVVQIQNIHHIAAIILTLEAAYHLGKAVVLMARRRLPGEMLVSMDDVRDAWQMVKYLLFLRKTPPKFGKFNFEQKITYWFLFFGFGILILTGFVIWFPEVVTRILPGGIVPASKLAHSTEAIVAGIFIIIWHFYHVHIQRLNLSIFTGSLSEEEMRTYHQEEYERLTGKSGENRQSNEDHA